MIENLTEQKNQLVADTYKALQYEMCSILNDADGKAKFEMHQWQKDIGGGITAVMQNGRVIEKAGLNFSHVKGKYTEQMANLLGVYDAENYAATGISSILHSSNPNMPTIHMNVRYFELDNGVAWFGGGIDLTPIYVDKQEAAWFHEKLKTICDNAHPEFYSKYKPWADDYFYIPHRKETRGVGGIFFDRVKPGEPLSFEDMFVFTQELAKAYPRIYAEIMSKKGDLIFTPQQKEWQKLRRGRYVEFNLVYDRGTKFGLASGGNTESILVSLPAEVNWEFQHEPMEGSAEAETLNLLKKGIDWIKIQ